MVHLNVQKKLNAPEGPFLLELRTSLQDGERVAIFGPSGSGKTSILRMIAGLLTPDAGYLEVDQETWLDTAKKINLKTQQRKIGLVFQDYGLFPHLSVQENLSYALEKNQDPSIISELLEVMELGSLRQNQPQTLSGGQKQRVALARALVRKPRILMLDEPLSALDNRMRSHLQDYLVGVHRQFQFTMIVVSHNIREIFRLADRVLILDQGKIIRQGTPEQVFFSSSRPDDFQFTGEVVGLEQKSGSTQLSILTGMELVRVRTDSGQNPPLTRGDQVRVSATPFHPQIEKLDD
ncbi:MAG: ATP-binding cassette domain-containing protein [Chitinophagaceae bacterium]